VDESRLANALPLGQVCVLGAYDGIHGLCL